MGPAQPRFFERSRGTVRRGKLSRSQSDGRVVGIRCYGAATVTTLPWEVTSAGSNLITCHNRTREACSRLRARPPQGSASGAAVGGDDFADFLLGVPDTSSIAFGNADKYFRESVYDAYITDDWRVNPQFTLNAGIRWEYGAPITELYGRLVNLDIASGFCGGSAGGGESIRGGR